MPYIPHYFPPGTVFDGWTVIKEYRIDKGVRIRRIALCRCECGKEKSVLINELKFGHSTNCGCRRQRKRLRGYTSEQLEYERHLKVKYRIDLIEYDRILKIQNNVCAVCKINTKLSVDHCHSTKKVRGLLCKSCNFGLGFLKDSLEMLKAAIQYLENPPAEFKP